MSQFVDIPVHLKKLFETKPEIVFSWHEQLKEHPNLGRTQWTQQSLEAMKQLADEHIDNCKECQRGLLSECSDPEKCAQDLHHICYVNGYCSVGVKLSDTYLDASHEFSWQADFPHFSHD